MDDPRSPWSTPSKSEYGTGEGFLELKESMILDADEEGEEEGRRQEEEEVVATLFVREMGDGEPSAEEMMPVEEAAPPNPENDQVMDRKQQQQQQQQEEIEEDQNEPPEVFENDSCVPVRPDSHCLDRDLDAVSSQGSSSGKDGNGGERDGARSQSRDPLVLQDRRRLTKRDVYPGGESRSPSPTKPFRKGSKGIVLKTKQSRHHQQQQQQQQLLQQQKKQKQRRSQSMDKSSVAPRLLLSELSVSETVGERLLLSPQQTQQQHQQTQDMGIQSKFSRSMNNVSSSSNASSAVSGGGPDSPRKKRQQIYRGIPKSRLRGGSEDSSTSSFRRKGSESSGSGPTSAAAAASGASVTGSSNSSPKKSPRKQKSEAGAAAAGSSGDQLISSPKKSVKKKKKRTARDVIELPFPYNTIKSDDLKYWCKELAATKKLDVEADRNQLVKDLAFTNAMVLKMNQIAKQVRHVL